jgi:hypothetical protein
MRFVLVHGGWQGGWCWDAAASSPRDGGQGPRDFVPVGHGDEAMLTHPRALAEALLTAAKD